MKQDMPQNDTEDIRRENSRAPVSADSDTGNAVIDYVLDCFPCLWFGYISVAGINPPLRAASGRMPGMRSGRRLWRRAARRQVCRWQA